MPPSQAELLTAFAQALQLPSDSEPFVITYKVLSQLGVTRADLTTSNAIELDLVDGPPTLVLGTRSWCVQQIKLLDTRSSLLEKSPESQA